MKPSEWVIHGGECAGLQTLHVNGTTTIPNERITVVPKSQLEDALARISRLREALDLIHSMGMPKIESTMLRGFAKADDPNGDFGRIAAITLRARQALAEDAKEEK